MHGRTTILLVEDEDALRELCARVLEVSGYTVLTAANAEEALVLVEGYDGRVDLLLTDMFMPGVSGSELACRVQRRRWGIRVLFTSGYPEQALPDRYGIDEAAFIGKPFSAEALRSKVQHVLRADPMTP